MKGSFHIQPRIKGGRDPLHSCILPETKERLVELAQRKNVSPSWVVAVILADATNTGRRQKHYNEVKRG